MTMGLLSHTSRQFRGAMLGEQTSDEARTELVNVFDMIRDEYQEEGRLLPSDVVRSNFLLGNIKQNFNANFHSGTAQD